MFKDRLRAARKNAEMTQKEVATAIGVTESAYCGYETGKRQPDPIKISAIASVLGVSGDYLLETGYDENKKSPALSDEANRIARQYDALDDHGRRVVRVVIDEETVRMASEQDPPQPMTKIIPLLGSAFAAGLGDPDFGNPWEDYEVPADSKAEFAVRISGNSMEPYLPDGSIQLARKTTPKDGEVGVFLLDGTLLVKQYCMDIRGSIYLFALNRERRDADVPVEVGEDRDLRCFGTILMQQRLPPLPTDPGWF